MISHHHFGSRARSIFLGTLLSLLPLVVFAQVNLPQAQVSAMQKSKPTLELKLKTLTPMACIGSILKLELEITNTGLETFKIDKADVWSNWSLWFYNPDSDEGLGEGRGSNCSHCRGNYIVIEPGGTYWDTHEFSLGKSNFLNKTDKYTLTTSIDSISSNEVIFELYDCGKSPKIEDKQ